MFSQLACVVLSLGRAVIVCKCVQSLCANLHRLGRTGGAKWDLAQIVLRLGTAVGAFSENLSH